MTVFATRLTKTYELSHSSISKVVNLIKVPRTGYSSYLLTLVYWSFLLAIKVSGFL